MSKKSTIISKETITRLIKDIKYITNNPLNENNIYYKHDEEDMMKGYALIIGSEDTPYFGGFYFFEITYPNDYPHSPPLVLFKTNGEQIRFNPNLYVNEKVCVSLLNTWKGDQWTSCQTISTLLLTLGTLLCKNPLLNEPGITRSHHDFYNYTEIIEYKNIDIAILKVLEKNPSIFLDKFEDFYPIITESFSKNKESLIKFIESKCKKIKKPVVITTTLYHMYVNIDYTDLLKKLELV